VLGEFVARAAPDLILVRHEAVSALGMSSMEQMAVFVVPAAVDTLGLQPGDRLRLAVRQEGDRLVALRIERR
jgi:formate-dependent phosphoribosylglycinamide formyltransferase (GAR transformylase)